MFKPLYTNLPDILDILLDDEEEEVREPVNTASRLVVESSGSRLLSTPLKSFGSKNDEKRYDDDFALQASERTQILSFKSDY